MTTTPDLPKHPHIPKPLLDWLNTIYPERCPDLRQPEREVWAAVGARGVVRVLQGIYDEQNPTTT